MVDTDCVVVGRRARGLDELHTYFLELLEQLGLAESLLELPHFRATRFRAHTPVGVSTLADYGQPRCPQQRVRPSTAAAGSDALRAGAVTRRGIG